jgi:Protein of unknown function (DUF3768)
MNLNTERIRALNDELRRNLPNGHAVMTAGIAALGPDAVTRIVKTIAVYDDFCQANDPYGEHDFGSFEADGQRIFFKIDYLDKALAHHSPDPSDPSVTERVITIMLAEEY